MKVLVIGVDGMDRDLVRELQSSLPVLSRLAAEGPAIKLTSIFPPDSTPAWATIYTGLTPANHGVINFVNLGDKTGTYTPLQMDDRMFRGKTFWDAAGAAGKKVSICLPFNISPGWGVNGSMVCRTNRLEGKNQSLSLFPQELQNLKLPPASVLSMSQGFCSQNGLGDLMEQCLDRTMGEKNLALKMMAHEPWDLFFVYFSALDGIQHYFWNFFDRGHPNYPGENPFEDVIPHFYRLIDDAVGELIAAAGPDTVSLIFSDHGHGLRPYKLVNMNEILRQQGYLVAKKSGRNSHQWSSRLRRLLKKGIYRFLQQYGADHRLMWLSQKVPLWKKVLASPSPIDWEKTRAYVSDLSTVKSYSYGGIRLVTPVPDPRETPELITEIINLLGEIRDPETSEKLVKWACRREDLYHGKYLDKYPEILLELKEGYGLGWEIQGDIFSTGEIHNIQPGAHKLDSPVFFLHGRTPKPIVRDTATLMDLAPTIEDLLEVKSGFPQDGISLFDADKGDG